MPTTTTSDSHIRNATRLRRTGGRLAYNNELLPSGTEAFVAQTLNGVASLVLDNNVLVPVLLKDIARKTFVIIGRVSQADVQDAVRAGARHEVIPGRPLTVVSGMILRRTGRPFAPFSEHYALHGEDLIVRHITHNQVWHDIPGHEFGEFPRRYLTDAYFTIIK